MRALSYVLIAFNIIMITGCVYNGAVYSEYQHFTLAGVRASPEGATPIDITFGYDRGVIAYIPKKNGNGDSSSIIAKNFVKASTNPINNSKDLLKIDASFYSGNTAIIAAAPPDVEVVLKSGDKTERKIKIDSSSPQDRITMSFAKPTIGIIEGAIQERRKVLIEKLKTLEDTQAHYIIGIMQYPPQENPIDFLQNLIFKARTPESVMRLESAFQKVE